MLFDTIRLIKLSLLCDWLFETVCSVRLIMQSLLYGTNQNVGSSDFIDIQISAYCTKCVFTAMLFVYRPVVTSASIAKSEKIETFKNLYGSTSLEKSRVFS